MLLKLDLTESKFMGELFFIPIVGFAKQVFSANGYLPDQFISEVTNKRMDAYGGSIENRARFALEVVQAVVERVGTERTSIRLSPFSAYQGLFYFQLFKLFISRGCMQI